MVWSMKRRQAFKRGSNLVLFAAKPGAEPPIVDHSERDADRLEAVGEVSWPERSLDDSDREVGVDDLVPDVRFADLLSLMEGISHRQPFLAAEPCDLRRLAVTALVQGAVGVQDISECETNG